jgi:leucyl-tRNA synthetase
MQTHWIGRSSGAEVLFRTESGDVLGIFTTRPDTLWGATFMVAAPNTRWWRRLPLQRNRLQSLLAGSRRHAWTRSSVGPPTKKSGVFTGGYAINPVNGERIPIWIADYVMMGYGAGAIMAVPAHDARDFAFRQTAMGWRSVVGDHRGPTAPVARSKLPTTPRRRAN